MRVIFTRDQVVARLDEMGEFLVTLRTADSELRTLSYDPDRHWPPGSGIGGGSGGGPSILAENEDGDLERVPATSVEVAALATDTMTDAKHALWAQVQSAHNALTNAINAYECATRHLRKPQPEPTDVDEIWCTSCERWGIQEPRGNPKEIGKGSTLCAFCARYQSANEGRLPPRRLCELRSEGVRLTAPVVAQIEAAERRDQRDRTTSKRRKKRGRAR